MRTFAITVMLTLAAAPALAQAYGAGPIENPGSAPLVNGRGSIPTVRQSPNDPALFRPARPNARRGYTDDGPVVYLDDRRGRYFDDGRRDLDGFDDGRRRRGQEFVDGFDKGKADRERPVGRPPRGFPYD